MPEHEVDGTDAAAASTVTLAFETSEVTEMLASRQHLFVSLGYRWAGLVVLAAAGGLLLWRAQHSLILAFGVMCLTATLVLTLMWVKAYTHGQRSAREQFHRLEDPEVRVAFGAEVIETSSSLGSGRTRWADVTRRVDTRDFVMLFRGPAVALILPKAALTAEVRALLEDRMG